MWNHFYDERHTEVATDNVEDVEQMNELAKEIPDGEEVAEGSTRVRNNTPQAPPFNRSKDQLGMLKFQHILDRINGCGE